MSWGSTIRSLEAAARRAEKAAQRRQREAERLSRVRAVHQAHQQAILDADEYEQRVQTLVTSHQECGETLNWTAIAQAPAPVAPERRSTLETVAQGKLAAFQPGIFDRVLGRTEKLRAALVREVEAARAGDDKAYELAYQGYVTQHRGWDERRRLAEAILQGDLQAYQDAMQELSPFAGAFDGRVELRTTNPRLTEVTLRLFGGRAVPQDIRSLTAGGKLSAKLMPRARWNELYRDHVCSCTLRVARESFAMLPWEMVVVTAVDDLLDTRTGHRAEQPILSVVIGRDALGRLNFTRLQPADAMLNFEPRRMDWKKTTGFGPVERLEAKTLGFTPPAALADSHGEGVPGSLSAIQERWRQTFGSEEAGENEVIILPAAEVAALSGLPPKPKLTAADSRRMALAAEESEFCLEPDARFLPCTYRPGQELALFKPAGQGGVRSPAPGFTGIVVLLQLCLEVARAEGEVRGEEMDVFRTFLENQLTPGPRRPPPAAGHRATASA